MRSADQQQVWGATKSSFSCFHASLPSLVLGWLLVVSTGQLSGQRYTLDEGAVPVPIYYQASQDAGERQIGELDYRVVLENGRPINSSIDSFYFRDAEEALLTITVTVRMERPNNKKIKDLRVIFPRAAFGAMGRNAWKLRSASSDPMNVLLRHNDSHTFKFAYGSNGVVNFNLPFVVAPNDAPFNYWVLPEAGSLRNHILSRQIKVLGVLNEEDRMWRRGKDRFTGVAGYLRKYPRGKYEDEAGIRFTNQVDIDYNRLVLSDAAGIPGAEKFITEYTPFADFTYVEDRLAEARQVLAGARARKPASPPTTNTLRSTRRRSPVVRVPTAPLEEDEYGDRLGYRILGEANGRQLIKLYNFKQPAYYDIYEGLLDIDDSRLAIDSTLSIKQLKQGELNLLIVEKEREGRFVSIPLNNTMQVGMTYDTILAQYNFAIEGGIEPYQLYLRPLENQRYDWGLDNIQNSQVSVPVYDLQRAGLEGKYLAQVSSAGSSRSQALSKIILTVPKTAGNYSWVYPLLIALGIGLFALLLLAILNRSGGKRGRGRNQRVRL